MAYRLEFSVEAERDFELIFDHLLRSYLNFGESLKRLDLSGAGNSSGIPAIFLFGTCVPYPPIHAE